MASQQHTINLDLIIQSYQQGIVLTQPNYLIGRPSLKEIFNLPIQCYFCDMDHSFIRVNQTTAEINGFHSENDAIAKTVHDIAKRETSARIIENNKTILRNQAMQIIEETILRKDDITFSGISIKFPWYERNKLVGIFGCSFAIDSIQSYTKVLTLITKAGLFNLLASFLKVSESNYYLSNREKEIISYLIRGKTAREIADKLNLSKRTVEHYLENIKAKTQSESKSELVDKMVGLFL